MVKSAVTTYLEDLKKRVGGALDWIVSSYQFKTDTLTGITHDFISDVNIIEKIE